MAGATGTGLTFSNNVTFNIALQSIINVATTGSSVFDSNTFIKNTSGSICSLADVGCTFTNITIVGATSQGMIISENGAEIGTWSNITIHSGANSGLELSRSTYGTISTLTCWRNTTVGLALSGGDLIISNLTLFGNTTDNITATGGFRLTLYSPTLSGDSTFATTNGINFSSTITGHELIVYSGDFGTISGIKTAHTNDIALQTVGTSLLRVILNNTKLASTVEVSNPVTGLSPRSFISSQKHDQTAGLHKTWKKYGIITIETTTTHTGSQSVKLTPNDASKKLVGPSFFVAVANGATITPTIYVYEDASYNGARARLIVKQNDAVGIAADTVLDTATAASDAAWEGLTGTTAAATDDGVMEFVVDCDGTAGNLFVDSFSVT